ncbi:alanine/ornithine racemase family PLP-dependent enzyme [Micromonospora sp. NPDC048843]|uniref:alanine/ornithine racemase family PLP-dependent enzyme n=1 Tax=Micromonospora sp. NPDC048843 TaxID=3155389 RepID=UPI0033EDE22F
MYLDTPRLELYIDRFEHNAATVIGLCRRHGVEVTGVTKVTGAHPALLRSLDRAGASMVADSRVDNLRQLAAAGVDLPTMLLRPPTPSEVADVVRWADYSLNSSLATMEALSQAAQTLRRRHRVVNMVDAGDLREGIWPDRVIPVIRKVARLSRIEVAGLGTNLACLSGVVPTTAHMRLLVDLRDECRAVTGLPLDLLSGGNSANLPMLTASGMPAEINNLRIGETIALGRNPLDRTPWPGTRQDTVRLVAEVVEVERKPSAPTGEFAQDAFGALPEEVDRGVRSRAICNVGRQDVRVEDLLPEDPGIVVVGASSDHLVLDVEDAARDVQAGAEIGFHTGYASLLSATTSPYVRKVVIRG